jgi:MFS family permease
MAKASRRNPHNLQQELHRDLNLLILAITFGMAYMTVYNGPSLNAFIRSLGAGDFVFAVIMAMPVFTGLLQLAASLVLQKVGKRKGLFIVAGLIQRLVLIPIALVPLFIPGELQSTRIWLVLILLAVNSGASAFMVITYSSWIGAIVPHEIRGRYFSRRTLISTITSLIVAPLSGLFLDLVKGPTGYAILFCAVALIGTIDIVIFFWIRDPAMVVPTMTKPLHMHILQPLRDKNYRQFILFSAAFQFSFNLTGSFFTPFMLEHLHMNMLAITLLTQTTMSLFVILFVGRTGRLMDRFGAKTVMSASIHVIAFTPLFWVFSTPGNYMVLIFLVQAIAGIVWPAFEMGTMNLSIWLAPEESRPSYLASYAFIVALFGVLPGQLLGGAIMEGFGAYLLRHPVQWMFGRAMIPFDLLLILTFLSRLASAVFLFPKLTDKDARGTSRDVVRAFFQKPSRWLGNRP